MSQAVPTGNLPGHLPVLSSPRVEDADKEKTRNGISGAPVPSWQVLCLTPASVPQPSPLSSSSNGGPFQEAAPMSPTSCSDPSPTLHLGSPASVGTLMTACAWLR